MFLSICQFLANPNKVLKLVLSSLIFISLKARAINEGHIQLQKNPTCSQANQFWISTGSKDFTVRFSPSSGEPFKVREIDCGVHPGMPTYQVNDQLFYFITALYDLHETKFAADTNGFKPDFYGFVRDNIKIFVLGGGGGDRKFNLVGAEVTNMSTREVSISSHFLSYLSRRPEQGMMLVHEARHLNIPSGGAHVFCFGQSTGDDAACDEEFHGGWPGGAYDYSFMYAWWLWRYAINYNLETKPNLEWLARDVFDHHFLKKTIADRLKWFGH